MIFRRLSKEKYVTSSDCIGCEQENDSIGLLQFRSTFGWCCVESEVPIWKGKIRDGFRRSCLFRVRHKIFLRGIRVRNSTPTTFSSKLQPLPATSTCNSSFNEASPTMAMHMSKMAKVRDQTGFYGFETSINTAFRFRRFSASRSNVARRIVPRSLMGRLLV